MHKYYNLFIYRMPGTDPKAFPCILCNNNTKKKKKQERRTINKPVSKYLKKTLHDHKQINVDISTMHRNRDNFPFKYGIHMYMFILKNE